MDIFLLTVLSEFWSESPWIKSEVPEVRVQPVPRISLRK